MHIDIKLLNRYYGYNLYIYTYLFFLLKINIYNGYKVNTVINVETFNNKKQRQEDLDDWYYRYSKRQTLIDYKTYTVCMYFQRLHEIFLSSNVEFRMEFWEDPGNTIISTGTYFFMIFKCLVFCISYV